MVATLFDCQYVLQRVLLDDVYLTNSAERVNMSHSFVRTVFDLVVEIFQLQSPTSNAWIDLIFVQRESERIAVCDNLKGDSFQIYAEPFECVDDCKGFQLEAMIPGLSIGCALREVKYRMELAVGLAL